MGIGLKDLNDIERQRFRSLMAFYLVRCLDYETGQNGELLSPEQIFVRQGFHKDSIITISNIADLVEEFLTKYKRVEDQG